MARRHTSPPLEPQGRTAYQAQLPGQVATTRPTTRALAQQASAQRKRAVADLLASSGDTTGARWERRDAATLEEQAAAVLRDPEMTPTPGSGERAAYAYPDEADRSAGLSLRDTLRHPTMTAAQAALERAKLSMDLGCLELAEDLAQTIQASNAAERMLSHQLAAVHHHAMHLLLASQRCGTQQQAESIEACRLSNASARLLTVFQEGLTTLARLRSGGTQRIVVQHISMNGGQAVIAADMSTGGSPTVGDTRKNGGTTPCDERLTPPGAPHAAGPKPAKRRRVSKPPCGATGAVACTAPPVPARPEATSTP
jgi:hypothetical protein